MLAHSRRHDLRRSGFVIPAHAGIQWLGVRGENVWPPASAGATTHAAASLGAVLPALAVSGLTPRPRSSHRSSSARTRIDTGRLNIAAYRSAPAPSR